jgi:Domain of unknown function (DUF4105)
MTPDPCASARQAAGAHPGSASSAPVCPSPSPGLPAPRRPRRSRLQAFLESATAPLKLFTNRPSNDRDWVPDLTVLPFAEIDGDQVTVHHVRNFEYRSTQDFTPGWYDKSFKLSDVDSVWYGVEPFGAWDGPAHTLLSFGFQDRTYLSVSVEIRRQKGDRFSAWKGLWNYYEIAYVIADERDVIGLRTNHRRSDVYLYQGRTERADSLGRILLDALRRANALREKPEFYNSLFNTCTTAILGHVNAVAPRRVPWSRDILFPSHSDRLAYAYGFLDRSKPLDELRRQALITPKAQASGVGPDFSSRIRER